MKKNELRNVPIKNYVILGIILLVTMLIVYYLYMWFDAYRESKLNLPIMNKYMAVVNYNELDNFIVENPNSIIYVSVLNDEEIRKFEIKFKNSFKNEKVNKELLYLNITNNLDNDRNSMILKYSLNSISMTNVPCIMVVSNGRLKSIYSIKNNNYNVDMAVDYINSVELEDDLK